MGVALESVWCKAWGCRECLRVVILNLDNLFRGIFQKLCFTSLVGLGILWKRGMLKHPCCIRPGGGGVSLELNGIIG